MLSHHERQELERIQQWFELDDPRLAKALGDGAPPGGSLRSRLVRLGMDTFALAMVVMGVVTLNFGLIFFGAIMLVVAACLHVTRWDGNEGITSRHRRLE
jgi:hypothetical protein